MKSMISNPSLGGVLYTCLFALLLIGIGPIPAAAQDLQIIDVTDAEDMVEFTFTSSLPVGTSFQPQYLKGVNQGWADIPDASVSPVEGMAGSYVVTAPKFAGNSGFYRVLNNVPEMSDPIQANLDEPELDELLLLWNQPRFNNHNVYSKVFYHLAAPGGGPGTSQLEAYPTHDFGAGLTVHEDAAQDSLAIDLDGDGMVDPLFAWMGEDQSIHIVLSQVSREDFTISTAGMFTFPGSVVREEQNSALPLIRLIKAELDGDPTPELLLGYTGASGNVELRTFEFDAGFQNLVVLGFQSDTPLPFRQPGSYWDRSAYFDIATGDFDGDDLDEIAVAAPEAINVTNGDQDWQLYVKFYDFDLTREISSRFLPSAIPHNDSILFVHDNGQDKFLFRIATETGDFDGDGAPELAIGYHIPNNDSQQDLWFIQLAEPNQALTGITLGTRLQTSSASNIGYPMDIKAFQLDEDPEMEIAFAERSLYLIDPNPADLSLTRLRFPFTINSDSSANTRRYLALANLDDSDPNYGARPELVVINDFLINGNSNRRLSVQTYQITGDSDQNYNVEQDAVIQDEVSNNSMRHFALVAADLGANQAKLGPPRRYTRTITGRPIVVLNSVPLHFDVINNTTYNVSGLFPEADCQPNCPEFYARYETVGSDTITVETQWNREWDIAVTVEGGFEIPIVDVGVEASVMTKFGEELDTYTSNSQTTTVSTRIDALTDDQIYATTITYSIWEYPVLVNGEQVGYVVVVGPSVSQSIWASSKDISVFNYRSNHEPGNLLSYQPSTASLPGDAVRELVSADTFSVSSGGTRDWKLTVDSESTTTESRTFNFSLRGSADFDIPVPWIPDVKVEGGYDTSKMRANTTTVTDSQGLSLFIDRLDGGVAGSTYTVTPFVYWDRSGAVVLDYSVDLPLGTPSIPTFWRQQYFGKPDPTFILPFRHDPEKGFPLISDTQRELTRDILTIPTNPRIGQEVEVHARISNFSLLGATSSFKVRFYLGDPDFGGVPITSTEGTTDHLIVASNLQPQGTHLIKFNWRIPPDLATTFLTIYAVIDPDNQMPEIHEDNNKGWNEILLRVEP